MNIDCCKSYVGKQIIGLAPSGGITPPPPAPCRYVCFQDFGVLPPNTLFFDAALTQPLFTNNIGDGALRSLMQSNGGELYGVWLDAANFIYEGCHLFYEGYNAFNIDVYDSNGYFTTLSFLKVSDLGLPCQGISCFSATIEIGYDRLYIIGYNTPVINTLINIPSNPYFNSTIQFSDTIQMTTQLKQLFGQGVVYSYNDNGDGTATLLMERAIDWSGVGSPIYFEAFDGLSVTSFEFYPC